MSQSSLPSFTLPAILDNPAGWGPQPQSNVPTFTHIDYKGERLGMISDWTNPKAKSQRMNASGVSMFDPRREDEEASFNLVDTMRAKPTRVRFTQRFGAAGRGRGGGAARGRGAYVTSFQRQGQGRSGASGANAGRTSGRGGLVAASRNARGGYRSGGYREEVVKEASVRVQPTWGLVTEIDFNQLQSVSSMPASSETLYDAGVLMRYQDLERVVRPRSAKPIPPVPIVSYPPASADPVLQRIATENNAAVASKNGVQIFAAEAVLSMLMVAPLTTYGWEVLVRKVSDVEIYFDSRPGSRVDQPPVCENNLEQLPTDADSPFSAANLASELERVQHAVASLVTSTSAIPNPAPTAAINLELQHPFVESEAKSALLYRRWSYPDNVDVIVRAGIDAYIPAEGEGDSKYVVSRAQIEVDSKTLTGTSFDWRDKLETQPTAVFVSELKANPTRFLRMAIEAYLADADVIKLSYASRTSVRDNSKHSLLLTTTLDPRDMLARSLKQQIRPLFSTLRAIINAVRSLVSTQSCSIVP